MIDAIKLVRAATLEDFFKVIDASITELMQFDLEDIDIQYKPVVIPDPEEPRIIYTAMLIGRK